MLPSKVSHADGASSMTTHSRNCAKQILIASSNIATLSPGVISFPSIINLLGCWFSNCYLNVVNDGQVCRSDICGNGELFSLKSIPHPDFI